MTFGLILAFGLAMSGFLGAAVYNYSQAIAARNSALLLSRVSQSDVPLDELQLGFKPQRLSSNVAVQKMLKGYPFVEQMAELLEQAGRSTTVAELLSHMLGSAVIGGVASWVAGNAPPLVLFIGMFASSGPLLYTTRMRSQRSAAFDAQLPHAIELISLYLRAGRSLPQAFLAATEELSIPASQEFGLAAEEYRLGRPLDIALKRMAVKYPTSVGLRLMAVAVSVLGQTGGNLVEVLERIKRILDATISYGLKVKSLTAESRNSATILSIVPGAFMALSAMMSPEYFNTFFQFVMGYVMFGAFLFLWCAGLIWIRVLIRKQDF